MTITDDVVARTPDRVRIEDAVLDALATAARAAAPKVSAVANSGECDSAIGPNAYLTALAEFATGNLLNGTTPVTLAWLEAEFHQPFASLEVSCAGAVDQVHQTRLAVEVLRAYLGDATPDAAYFLASYVAILVGIGTSYEELRLARHGDAARRESLAARLGIDVAHLDALLLVGADLTEQALAQLFGLRSTTGTAPLPVEPDLYRWQRARLTATWALLDHPADAPATLPPLIDPDVIPEDYVVDRPPPDDAARLLWTARRTWVDAELATLDADRRAQPTEAKGFDAVTTAVLGEGGAALDALAAQRAAGQDIAPALAALGLLVDEFGYLVTAYRILAGGDRMLESEWDSVLSILTEVAKRTLFPQWRAEEAQRGVVLTPESFAVPEPDPTVFPPPPRPPLPAWRAPATDRAAWEATLRARTDQLGQLRQGLASVVGQAEDATLPGLRDRLVARLPASAGTSIAEKAEWFSLNFQIDTTLVGTQLTTPVGQAIETLQGVLWAVRTRQLATRPSLVLRSQVDFDDAWPWIGSYASWQAQQLVVLYPENFLQAGLRPYQSPAFARLVDATRDRPSLTPSQARVVAGQFASAFEDACRVQPGAACTARTRVAPDGDPHGSHRDLYYTVGVAPSRLAYWTRYDALATAGWQDAPWDVVPGLTDVASVVAALPYAADNGRHWIVLVAVVGIEAQRVVLTRYDLDTQRWDAQPADVVLPDGALADGVTLAQPMNGGPATDPPQLFAATGDKVVAATLCMDATSVDSAGWQPFPTAQEPITGATGVSAAYVHSGSWQLVTRPRHGLLRVVTSNGASGDVDGRFVGTVNFPGNAGFLVYRLNTWQWTDTRYVSLDMPTSTSGTFPATIRGLAVVTGTAPGAAAVRASWTEGDAPHRAELTSDGMMVRLKEGTDTPLASVLSGPFDLGDTDDEAALAARRTAIRAAYAANTGPCSVVEQMDEAYCYAPVHIATQLQAAGQYVAALDWLRTVFDYTVPWQDASPFGGVTCPRENAFARWLADPLDAHLLAATRGDARIVYALTTEVSCLLAFGDSEFSRDTAESVPRARAVYLDAVRLLGVLAQVRAAAAPGVALPARDAATGAALGDVVSVAADARAADRDHLRGEDGVAALLDAVVAAAGAGPARWVPPAAPPGFATPRDTVTASLRLHADVNLYKIRNGCNMAGMVRRLDPYAVPMETGSGYPVIGGQGQLGVPTAMAQAPTPYRYAAVVERAKQLAALAGQLETALLAALEKRDAEYYTLMRARQDLGLAQAGVQLQDLRVREAQDNVTLAQLGKQRAESQAGYYGGLLDEGVSDLERSGLVLMGVAAGLEAAAGATNFLAAALPASISAGFPSGVSISTSPQSSAMAVAAGFSSLAGAANTTANMLTTMASYERRRQDWEQQRNLAEQDVAIGGAQVTLAQDNVRIVGQDRVIAAMQAGFAATNVEYLATKFTNVALYEWMSQVLEGVYRSLLQQATSMAQVAAAQLAFERQETPPAVIKADYWQMPLGGISSGGTASDDRKGLTGSYRLLDDIYRLDQYAFATAQRKLQLTKTVSLARMAPAEFQRLRQTGVMEFATPSAMFDADFPGHYLRLVSRVRVSMIALVPAVDSVKATLTSSGTSRAVVGDGDVFRTVVVKRVPEQVALTSARDATGLFELSAASGEMLLPFESTGVDTSWRLELPKPANAFDFTTLADVLLTIEYTALASDVYRSQVVRRLPLSLSADRPYSFRAQLPDQWYDLHNPPGTSGPLTVRFGTGDGDFPPNVLDVTMTQIAMLFERVSAAAGEVEVTSLTFRPPGGSPVGGGATSVQGVVSTRRGNASAWVPITGRSPAGEWELTFPASVRPLFASGEIRDVVFDITYRYRTAVWPGDEGRQ